MTACVDAADMAADWNWNAMEPAPVSADQPSWRVLTAISFMWIDRMCIRGEKQNLVLLGADLPVPADAEAAAAPPPLPDADGGGDVADPPGVVGPDGVDGADDPDAPLEPEIEIYK